MPPSCVTRDATAHTSLHDAEDFRVAPASGRRPVLSCVRGCRTLRFSGCEFSLRTFLFFVGMPYALRGLTRFLKSPISSDSVFCRDRLLLVLTKQGAVRQFTRAASWIQRSRVSEILVHLGVKYPCRILRITFAHHQLDPIQSVRPQPVHSHEVRIPRKTLDARAL